LCEKSGHPCSEKLKTPLGWRLLSPQLLIGVDSPSGVSQEYLPQLTRSKYEHVPNVYLSSIYRFSTH
jgi:hypothetical protein